MLFGAILSLAATTATAQTVVDPHVAEFDPSADHYAQLPTGEQMVSRYDLEFFAAGASIPFQILDIGKPVPESDGKIRVSFAPSWPSSGVVYEARVAAIGPTGFGESVPSNTFTFTSTCGIVLSAATASMPSAGGTSSVSLLTGSTCAWSAVSSASWLTVQSPSSSTGNGTINFSAAANAGTTSRTANISVGGQSIAVTQSGSAGTSGACATAVSPSSLSISAAGAPESRFSVAAPSTCSWSATSPVSWFMVGGGSRSGSGGVDYLVPPNTSSSSRSVTVMVAGIPVVATQAGTTVCAPVATPSALLLGAAGGNGSVSVAVGGTCGWNSSSPVAWASVSPASGTGNASVTYSVQPNTATTTRTATLTIGGVPVSLTQAGATPCAVTLSATGVSVGVNGGTGTVGLTTGSGCTWNASSPVAWATVSPTSGTGSKPVTYSVQPNTSSLLRVATLTIGGLPVLLTQSATTTCSFALSTSSLAATAPGASGSISVSTTSSCSWTASSSASWVTLSRTSGTGGGSVGFVIAANTSTSARTATLTIAGKTVTVSQTAATSCTYALASNTFSVDKWKGEMSVKVIASSSCGWTAKSNVSWIVLSKTSGKGTDTLMWFRTANTTGKTRTGTMTIAGQTVTVTQKP